MLQIKWEEYEKDVNALNNWFSDQSARLDKFHRIGHEVSVQHALNECKVKSRYDCSSSGSVKSENNVSNIETVCIFYYFQFQALHEQLESKELEIESIKQLGTTLMEIEDDMPPSAGGFSISDTCDGLNQQWADLDHGVRI